MKSTLRMLSVCAVALLGTSAAFAGPEEDLQSVMDDHWAWSLEQSPTFATSLGVRKYDDRLGDFSLKSYDEGIDARKAFAARLDTIDASGLSETSRLNHELLALELANEIEGAEYGGKYLLMTNRYGPHTQFTGLPDRLPFFTKADYESYVARLNDIPRAMDEAIGTLQAGVDAGWTQPCAPMEGFEDTISAHIVKDADKSVFMSPFASKPAVISDKDWKSLKSKATRAVKRKVVPSFEKFHSFYTKTYGPACRTDIGASSLPGNGAEYYAYRARVFTTTTRTPEEIHQLGLSEVARIRGEMDKIIKEVDFKGTFKEFQAYLRSEPKFYPKTPEERLMRTAAMSKRIDGEMPKLFGRLPRMPYTVKPIPDDIAEKTTTAYYERPAGDGSRAGVYRINLTKLDTRPLYELMALSLHEAVPGHHHQIALSQELDLPNFRRFGGFTAFIEGWGLYAEQLGYDVGLYDTPYDRFGQLSYEMWRACRLVVDTGMHMKGWGRQQAIDYMLANTALSEHNITSEVDRYISWPGQALAYKSGQLKMSELRARAEKDLGPKFDIRAFHDALLENGAIPLSVLEAKMTAWIEAQK